MSHTITPDPKYDTGDLVRTVDGELWSDASGPGPYGPLLQRIADRLLYARGGLWGQFVWSGHFAAGGTAAAPAITVGPIEAVTLRASDNVWRPYFTSGESAVGASAVEGGGSLSAGTRYYVYAYVLAGDTSVRFQITTTPPTAAAAATVLRNYKRDQDANYRYIGTFFTDGSGNPIPTRAVKGRYRFQRSAMADSLLRFANNDNSTGWASAGVPLAAMMPPHARVARLRLLVRRDGALSGGVRGEVRTGGDTTSISLAASAPSVSGADTEAYVEGDVVVSSTQTIDYQCSASPASGYGVTLHGMGFDE